MKKLATIVLLCVLVGSFALGILATDLQAKSDKIPGNCVPSRAYSYCDLETCKMMDPYICNGEIKWFWSGLYCC